MATPHTTQELYNIPKFEFLVEERVKKLQYSLANFAQLRFKRAVQMRLSANSEIK